MKRALCIVSVLTLVVLGIASLGQALVFAWDVTFTPDGTVADPTPQAVIVSAAAAIGGILSMPLVAATFVLGVIATSQEKQYGWLAALFGAGALAVLGIFGMAWVLLSTRSPIAFQLPLATIALVTMLYCLVSAPRRTAAS
ncbi:MAG TPA: hypothetical protein VE258_03745 [Ktedonobacterales bacterium]|nr:hypothetical protein [Ktedonobacterales bacterium]